MLMPETFEGARTLARRNIEAFNDPDHSPIITNAGGRGSNAGVLRTPPDGG